MSPALLLLALACGETDAPSAAASSPSPGPAATKPEPAAAKPGTAAKLPVLTPQGSAESYDKAEFETLHGGYGSLPKAKASSTLAPQGRNTYGVENLADDSPFTAWVEGEEDGGVGQSIDFAWECGDPGWSSSGQLSILNGYQKSAASFTDNGRVRVLEAAVDGTPVATLQLEDRTGEQIFDLPVEVGQQVRLTIREVWPGKKWQDTALSELWVSCGP